MFKILWAMVLLFSQNIFSSESYLVFNLNNEKSVKLLWKNDFNKKLKRHNLACYIKHDNMIFGSEIHYLKRADLYELKMAVATMQEISKNTIFPPWSQHFIRKENLALFGKKESPEVIFSVVHERHSIFKEMLGSLETMEVIQQKQTTYRSLTKSAYCVFVK